jgi:hypothetical protein
MKRVGSDLVSFAFDSQVAASRRTPLYVDAACPSRSLGARQFRTLVRKLVAGFKSAGLRRGDRVLVHLFNNVRMAVHSPRMTPATGPLPLPLSHPMLQLTGRL